MSAHLPDITEWIGRTERVHDSLALTQALAASAMFDADNLTLAEGSALPPLWQWFYFLPRAPQSQLDVDGHPQRGGFMPPVPLPRRMFAGARVRMHQSLRIGAPALREGVIQDVKRKSGRSGELAFVTVRYRFMQEGALCMEEEQDIVYREPGAPVRAPDVRAWSTPATDAVVRDIAPDSRMLFRFSALTFNAHRIHYDREYALRDEGYPGLVVHGPLNAMLLMRLAEDAEQQDASRRGDAPRAASMFSFRGVAPVFDTGPIRLVGIMNDDRCELEALSSDGATALRAEVMFGNDRTATAPDSGLASAT